MDGIMKKKLLLLYVCLFAFTGCSEKENLENEERKINLNDNIMVTLNTKSTGNADCFFYMFVDNLQKIFPDVQIKKNDYYNYVSYWSGSSSDTVSGEISNEELTNNIGKLNFDTDTEKKIIDLFKKYQKDSYTGIKNIEYVLDNHRLGFTYNYLIFNDYDYELDSEIFDADVQDMLIDAVRFNGPCGGFDYEEEVLLTEEICDNYNLNCGRW